MKLLDDKFKQQPWRYLLQSLLATVSIMIILSTLNLAHQTTMIASLGASTFIVFAMPSAHSAKPRGLVGGYAVGIFVGVLFDRLFEHLINTGVATASYNQQLVLGALAVGLTIFLMVITNTEHPPAVGVALALVINQWELATLVVLAAAAVLLALVRLIFGKWLIDLH